MAGEQANADENLPNLGDDEEAGESTIAMASPTFEPVFGNAPSPTSNPPPAAGHPPAVPPPHPGPPARNLPPSPFGSPGPSPPGVAGAGATPKGRPQTVIGLAPPPAGAPRPGAARPGARGPAGWGPDKGPALGAKPGNEPPPPWPSDDDAKPAAKVAKPETKDAKSPGDDLGFGLDSGVADAARAAVAKPASVAGPPFSPVGGKPPGPPTPRSPLASTGFARGPHGVGTREGPAARPGGPVPPPGAAVPPPPVFGPPQPIGTDQDASTTSVPRDELDRARQLSQANAPLPRPFEESEEEDESTRAVPRDELVRGSSPEGQIVVGDGDDAVGDDATLAVQPGQNAGAAAAAKNAQSVALAQTLSQDDPQAQQQPPWGGHSPSWGGNPPAGFPSPNAPQPAAPGYPGWQDPAMQQQQGSWMSSSPQQPQQPVSNPNAPASNPQMLGMPQSGQMPAGPMHPMTPHGTGPTMQSMGQPAQHPFAQGQRPLAQPAQQSAMPWASPEPGGRRIKLSGQILLLAIVGVICLAIFITGIVLFATTKF